MAPGLLYKQTTIWETTWIESAALTTYDWFNTIWTVWKSCWLTIIYFSSQRWVMKSYKHRPSTPQPSLPFFQRQRRSYTSSLRPTARRFASQTGANEKENAAERNGPGGWQVQAGLFPLKSILLVAQSAPATDAGGWRWNIFTHLTAPVSPSLIHSSITQQSTHFVQFSSHIFIIFIEIQDLL